MAYNRVNILRHYLGIINLTREHYDPDVTTYKGVWRKYIYPQYHLSYQRYLDILAIPVEKELEEEEKKHGRRKDPAQLSLFEEETP